MNGNLLELKNVSHIYDPERRNAKKAVDSISFAISKGETFGLVGESGCGKTTTGKMIVKLLGVTEGQIIYDGQDISRIPKKDLLGFHRRVQMIFQDPYASLDPKMTVREILAEGIRTHRLCREESEIDDRVSDLLKTVGLHADHASRYPHEFSGGQRQRIGIARALAVEPEFIVCDEPISALDVSIQAQIVNMLKDLQKKSGYTFLFIAHDLAMVKYVSDRIGVMCNGRLVELGDSDSVYYNPIHPYTKSLVSVIPIPDPVKERSRVRIQYDPSLDRYTNWEEVENGHFALV